MILAILMGVGAEGAAALCALQWALPKSNRVFFSVFAGDVFLRLIGLAFIVWRLLYTHASVAMPLVTLAFSFVAVSLIQIPFLYKAR